MDSIHKLISVKFRVVDVADYQSYNYDPDFNFVVGFYLDNDNNRVCGIASNGDTYVLDRNDKSVCKYISGTTTVSKTLHLANGSNLSAPSGMSIDGDEL